GSRRGTDEGFANRGDGVRNCGARLPRDRLPPCPRLRARAFSVLRAGPLGVDRLGSPRPTPLAGGRLLCGRLLPLGGNGSCSWRLTSRACGASFLVGLPRRHSHLLVRKGSAFVIAPSLWDAMSRPSASFPSSHGSPGPSPATDRPGRIWPSRAALYPSWSAPRREAQEASRLHAREKTRCSIARRYGGVGLDYPWRPVVGGPREGRGRPWGCARAPSALRTPSRSGRSGAMREKAPRAT